MSASNDRRNKIIAVAAFSLVAAGVLYYQLNAGGVFSSSAPAPPIISVTNAGTQTATPAAAGRASTPAPDRTLDPTLKMSAMQIAESLVYSGSGRNIFSMTSAPIAIPKPIAPARPKQIAAPVPAGPAAPPPPPPIDLKFFGTETTAGGTRQAFLLHGDDVFLAAEGDVVQRRYRIVSISARSIVVEDMSNNNRQTLPLQMN
ncbi:MAG: hypothetical protein KGK08_11340 [Acidobacteriota bacterium]|nr:hypothetical protein [Acidobacteriota bacterium]